MDVVAAGCIAAQPRRRDAGRARRCRSAAGASGRRTARFRCRRRRRARCSKAIRGATTASPASASRRQALRSFAISCRRERVARDVRRRPAGGDRLRRGHAHRLAGRPTSCARWCSRRADAASPSDTDADYVTALEFDVDDMTGEEIALAARPPARRCRRARRVDRHALRQEGTPACPTFACSCTPRDVTCGDARVLHGDLHARRARARGARGRCCGARGRACADAVTVKVAERPGGVRTGKAAHDDVAGAQGLDAAARRHARRAEARALKDAPSERASTASSPRSIATNASPSRSAAGVDSMTLAHIAARDSRASATMYHAASPGRARIGARARGSARRAPRLAARGRRRAASSPTRAIARIRSTAAITARRTCTTASRAAPATRSRPAPIATTSPISVPACARRAEHDVVHPYVEAGASKRDIYELARALGLADLARLPAQPCLASRVETGIAIDAADLAFVDAVEAKLASQLRRARRPCAAGSRIGAS